MSTLVKNIKENIPDLLNKKIIFEGVPGVGKNYIASKLFGYDDETDPNSYDDPVEGVLSTIKNLKVGEYADHGFTCVFLESWITNDWDAYLVNRIKADQTMRELNDSEYIVIHVRDEGVNIMDNIVNRARQFELNNTHIFLNPYLWLNFESIFSNIYSQFTGPIYEINKTFSQVTRIQ